MKRALEGVRLINSKRQPPSLKRILAQARFNFPAEAQTGNTTKTKRCRNGKCGTCEVLSETNEILFNNNQTPFKVKESINCSTEDIIYVINALGVINSTLEKQVASETVRVHKQQIFPPYLRKLYFSHHIAHCAIGKRIPFKITPIFHVNRIYRIYREEMK